jgi:hypothetical protein
MSSVRARAAKLGEIDIEDHMAFHAISGGNSLRGFELERMPLTVTERQRVNFETLFHGDGKRSG